MNQEWKLVCYHPKGGHAHLIKKATILLKLDWSLSWQVWFQFNPKKTKRGFPPQKIRALAVLSGTKLWLSNRHVIIIFGVYNNWKKNLGGCIKKNLKNFAFEKFFFVKTKSKIFKNSIFANIFYQTVLFNTKYQFEMISAFIWCIYCPYWSKIIYFQKFLSWKLKILLCHMRLLWRPVLEKIWITVWFLKIL